MGSREQSGHRIPQLVIVDGGGRTAGAYHYIPTRLNGKGVYPLPQSPPHAIPHDGLSQALPHGEAVAVIGEMVP
jgi:hypothetical protein